MLKVKTKLFWDSFLHSNKSKSKTKLILTVALSIFLSILLAVIIAAASGINPGQLIGGLFVNAVNDPKTLAINVSIFIVAGLSFIFAYKVGLFNIGITGQMMTAGITCLGIATAIGNSFPAGLSQIFMLIIAMLVAMAVGMIVILLKVYLNVNEVISSILINWIVFFLVRLIVLQTSLNPSPGTETNYSVPFPETFRLAIAGTRHWYSGGWIPVLIITGILVAAVAVTLKYTVFGRKVISVGKSFSASKYLGINTKMILFASMAISSAIAGILGYLLYASKSSPSIPVSMSVDALPVEGMNGVSIGLISLCNPVATIPVAFVLGWIQTSSSLLFPVPATVADLINGFVILGAALFTLFLQFKPWIWLNQWLVCKNYAKNHQKFVNEFDIMSSKYFSMMSELSDYLKIKKYKNKIVKLSESIEITKKMINSIEINEDNEKLLASLNKKLNKLINSKKSLENSIVEFDKAIDTWNLNISSEEIKKMINENLESFINLIYSKYSYELVQIKAQFKKRNLVDKASQTFWSEFEKQKNKELTIDAIHLSEIKSIKKVEDKIYNIEFGMKQKLDEKLQLLNDNVEVIKFNYENKIAKLEKKLAKYEQENNLELIEATKNKIELLKEQSEIKVNAYKEKVKVKTAEWTAKFENNFNEKQALIPNYEETIQKIKSDYSELENKFINDYNNKVSTKIISREKLDKVYSQSIKKAEKIELDSEQKELLIKWINDSYNHALSKNKGVA